MYLNQKLNTILDLLRNRNIIHRDRILTMMGTLNFDKRLIEDITAGDIIKIEDVIDELLNQSLIWVDDETLQGDILYLKTLILATDDRGELLRKYNDLLSSLHNDVNIQAPSLPEGLIRDISKAFVICGWWKCRAFLVSLG